MRAARPRWAWACLVACIWVCVGVRSASAHEFRPGHARIEAQGEGRWSLRWEPPRLNAGGSATARLQFTLEDGPCAIENADPEGAGRRATITCPAGEALRGRLRVEGLPRAGGELLVHVEDEGRVELLTGEQNQLQLGADASGIFEFAARGVDHVITGWDHLLFLLCLVGIAMRRPEGRGSTLAWAVTTFSLAHAASIAIVALGRIALPAPVVEVGIAASIVVMAASWLRELRDDAPPRRPAHLLVSAALFGLLHGLGFGMAWLELRLEGAAIGWAMLGFNLGVEAAQLLFAGLVALALVGLARIQITRREFLGRPGAWLRLLVPYAVGTVAAAWTWARLLEIA